MKKPLETLNTPRLRQNVANLPDGEDGHMHKSLRDSGPRVPEGGDDGSRLVGTAPPPPMPEELAASPAPEAAAQQLTCHRLHQEQHMVPQKSSDAPPVTVSYGTTLRNMHSGLANPTGENHCFLNALVQVGSL